MTNQETSESTELRRWPMIAGALGGVVVSAAIVVPEAIHYAQEFTPLTISIETVLSNLFVATTAYLGNVIGNRQHEN